MPESGQAAVMTKAMADMELRRFPLPVVSEGGMLVKVTCCTICGSDLHTWQGRRASPTPIILGHEIVGEIVEIGRGAEYDAGNRPIQPGDRVTWTIMDSCGKCYYCREKGLPMKCRNLRKYGHECCAEPPHFLGGFAEYCYISPGTCVIKLPDTLADEVAAPANCALATVIAGWEAISLKPLENVLIQGAGALGIYAAALAKAYGCARIIVTDVLNQRLEFVKSFGATDTLNTAGMSPDETAEVVRGLTAGFGVDAAMECAGVPEIIPAGLKSLRVGGRYVQHGNVFPGAEFTYDVSDIIFRYLTITGVHNYDVRHLQIAVNFLDQNREAFPFGSIVTHRVGLDEISDGLHIAESGEAIRVAVLP